MGANALRASAFHAALGCLKGIDFLLGFSSNFGDAMLVLLKQAGRIKAQRIQPGQGADLSNGRLYAGGAKWRQPDAQRCRYDLFGFHIFGTAAIFKIAADYTK